MTKAEYIDFVRNSLPMVDKTSRFHRQQVAAAINVAVNTVFYDMYEQNPKVFKKSLERYTTQVTGTPSADGQTGQYAVALAFDVVDLPKVAGGIIEVATAPSVDPITYTQFAPIGTMTGAQLYGSEASLPANVVGYSFAGGREVEFWGMTALQAVNDVLLRVIKQFKSLGSTDNVVLPYGKDSLIMDKVREYLGVTPPKDTINNEVDGQ
jgi:hypothetical protein